MAAPRSQSLHRSLATLLQSALANHQQGRLVEAEANYRRILAIHPGDSDSLHLLGLLEHQRGRNDAAIRLIGGAIAVNSTIADFHANLGAVLLGLARPAQALLSFDAALRLRRDSAEIQCNRGAALKELGRYGEALEAYQAAIRLRAHFAEAHCNRADVLRLLGRAAESLQASQTAIDLRPDLVEAHYNKANALLTLGRCGAALPVYDQVLRQRPDYVEAHSNRGNALKGLGRIGAALAAFEAALCLRPDFADALANRANSLIALGRLDAAIRSCRRALTLRPDFVDAMVNLANALTDSGRLAEALDLFQQAIERQPDHRQALCNRMMVRHYLGDAADALLAAAQHVARQFAPAETEAPDIEDHDPERKLRIGYVSGDLGRHPVGHFLAPVLRHHDRGAFEIFCYSNRRLDDALTATLRGGAHHWRDLVGVDDETAAALIRQDSIDLLIDLSGYTEHNRLPLFARKPAPLQLTWMGFWGTTGLPAIDAILSDAITIPPAEERFYSERVVRLPGVRFCYAPPAYAPEPRRAATGVTFGSFNNLAKVGPEVIALWARLLDAVVGSRLLLKWKSLGEEANRQRLRDAFAAHSIGADRLILRDASPHDVMLAEYGDVDVALDPFPFSGGLTSCEALWMGVPLVTLPRGGPVSRQTAAFLTLLGKESWIAADEEDYLRIAASLAADRDGLADVRRSLRPAMAASALCDGKAFTGQFEQALRQLWRDRCALR